MNTSKGLESIHVAVLWVIDVWTEGKISRSITQSKKNMNSVDGLVGKATGGGKTMK